jgi:general secretion pathway protein H
MKRGHRVGMTLIEVLVTLAIVAVMASMVVLGIGGSDRGLTVQTEANRLAERIGLAADEAMVTRRPLALSWDSLGYQFVTRGAGGSWVPDTHELLGARRDLPRGLTLTAAAPALIDLTDASLVAFDMSVTDAKRSSTVAFDGLNATASFGEDRP